MAFGVEIYGAHGRLQLGSGVSNYYMVEKGTITGSAWGDMSFNRDLYGPPFPPGWWEANEGATSMLHSIPASLPYDFYALGGSQITFAPLSVFGDGARFNAPPSSAVTSGPVSGSRTLYWYTFRSYTHLAPLNTGFGMEIINPDTGLVSFSLRHPKVLKTVAKYDYTESAITLPTGKTLAFIAFGEMWRDVAYTLNPVTGLMGFPAILDCTINGSNQLFMSRNSNYEGMRGDTGFHGDTSAGGVIAIDVTGY